ncbi:MAG: hypothetical protein E7248_05700 [Paenibacillaceae bacterium]|nr:hypothetical protein [Paenibacillaceae bacterium]
MIHSSAEYFKTIGFKEDPFASTNALKEEFLEEYFITPPYYHSLVGSVKSPKSSFVIAPRGTGKTAQRVMLEKLSEKENGMLAVVYDDFPIEKSVDLKKLTLDEHLKRIMRILLIALLSEANNRIDGLILNSYEKKQIIKLIQFYLCGINTTEVENSIKKLKGLSGKLHDLWIKAGKPITSIVNSILTKNKMGEVDLDVCKSNDLINSDELSSHYDFIEHIFNTIGITSVFILVDSIDETVATGNNAEKSYLLIKPFILDLRLLERNTIVFKFFVWNKIEEFWAEEFRKDRIEHFVITWKQEEIRELISKRLAAFSYGKISKLKDILNCDDNTIELIYLFANNSPRDVINIMKSIFDEHLRLVKDQILKPEKNTIILGIENFCKNKFEELISNDKQRINLKRVKLATFTIPYLYNEIFKCESSTARNILMPWTQAGIVYSSNNKIRVDNSPNPINIYTFSDLRIARYVCSNQKLEEFVKRNVIQCPECKSNNIFDKDNKYGLKAWQCKDCMTELLDNCNDEVINKRIPTQKSKDNIIEGQISLFDL